MSSLSLFDDWDGGGSITHSSSTKDPAAKATTRLWKLWCLRTEREDSKTTHKEFAKAVRSAFSEGMSEQELENVVEGAARTEPRTRDPQDIRRLTTAITNPKIRKFALNALSEGASIEPHPGHRQRMSFVEVESVLETTRADWGSEDIESAVLITEKYEADDLIEIADKVALMVGHQALFPSEILRYAKKVTAGNFKVKKDDRRSSYAAGVVELEKTGKIDFYADKAADIAFNKNVSPKIIQEFHNQAPTGYWEAVTKLLRASKTSADAIYSSLEEEFNWHPSQREPITKGKR